jgi:hypothetical protein
MPFSVQELENAANAAIDFHFKRGDILSQTIQGKPLLERMRSKTKNFQGGKENITRRVKGEYTTGIMGFEHDDSVTYRNPANIKQATYPWKLIHAGISFTMHELLKNGISITDTSDGSTTSTHQEQVALANVLEDKLEDMQEGIDRGFNLMWWQDGTQDSKQIPGLTSIITTTPSAAGVVGGIDQSANSWWRNRATLGIDSSTASNQNLVQTLQKEWRQLRRYGGQPNLCLAGSDLMDAFEKELRSKGNYTLEGWAKSGRIDASVADIEFKGTEIMYDPTLDDLSKSKYLYVIDDRRLYPMVIQGENMKKHNPARPENKYVFYRAVTYAGGLVGDQRNCHGVYSIA